MRRFPAPLPPVIAPIKQRLDDFRQQRRVQAGSLIISAFGDAILPRGGRIWLGSLIRLLEPLELNERLVRTSVFRLAKEEWLRTETVGRRADYLLTPTGRRRFDEASRHIYASHAPIWDRRWRLILVVGDLDPKARDAIRRALFWQGFGALGNECFVHPSADLTAAFDALVAEGLGDQLDHLMPLLAADSRSGIPENIVPHAVAVVRELLSNVAKHAQATWAQVTVAVKGDELSVTVVDNGIGFVEPKHRRGLANVARRADSHSGLFTIEQIPPKGTKARWQIYLPRESGD